MFRNNTYLLVTFALFACEGQSPTVDEASEQNESALFRTVTVSGRALNFTNGQGVAGATACVLNTHPANCATVAADGTYTLIVKVVGIADIDITAPGFVSHNYAIGTASSTANRGSYMLPDAIYALFASRRGYTLTPTSASIVVAAFDAANPPLVPMPGIPGASFALIGQPNNHFIYNNAMGAPDPTLTETTVGTYGTLLVDADSNGKLLLTSTTIPPGFQSCHALPNPSFGTLALVRVLPGHLTDVSWHCDKN